MRSRLTIDGAITAYQIGRTDEKLERVSLEGDSLYGTVLDSCDLIDRAVDVCEKPVGHRQIG